MDQEVTQQVEETTPAVDTPAQEASPTGAPESAEAPAYSPNYKYKSYDQEYEFDEYMKPLVSNKQVEERLRELYAAQRGIEGVSKARDKAQAEYQEYKKQWNPVVDLVQKANKAYQDKDYDAFFKTLGVPEADVLKYAYKRLEYMDMPEDRRKQVDETRQLRESYSQTREEAEYLREQFQEVQRQKTLNEIDQALSSQEVSSIARSFDQRNGQGAFKQEVINRGILLYQSTGQSLTPAQVVEDLVNKYGFSQQQEPAQARTQAPSQVVERKELPVMPVAKGGSASVAARQIKTLDDLKAIKKEKYGY
jgi:hypothetical protein